MPLASTPRRVLRTDLNAPAADTPEAFKASDLDETPRRSTTEADSDDDNDSQISGKQLFSLTAKKRKKKSLLEYAASHSVSPVSSAAVSHKHTPKRATPLKKSWTVGNKDSESENEENISPVKRSTRSSARKSLGDNVDIVIESPSARSLRSRTPLGKTEDNRFKTPENKRVLFNSKDNKSVSKVEQSPTRRLSARRRLSAISEEDHESTRSNRSSRRSTPARKNRTIISSDEEVGSLSDKSEEFQTKSASTSPKNETPSGTRRSQRLLAKTNVDSRAVLGTPVVEQLRTKRRLQKRLVSIKDESDEEEEENFDSDSSGSARSGLSSEDELESENEIEDEDTHTSYFALANHKKIKTSDNTLSKLPMLEQNSLLSMMKQLPLKHTEEVSRLHQRFKSQFSQWMFEISEGYNLLFYGYGSKLKLLSDFAESHLSDAPLLVVNGFFPTITIRHILSKIMDGVVDSTEKASTPTDQLRVIRKYFSDPERNFERLYLLIHNIDGYNLRSEKIQANLSDLASIPNIYIIASIDHINAPILWDSIKLNQYRWIWHDITTFSPYTVETSYETSYVFRDAADKKSIDVRGALHVLRSLPGNTKKIFKELAVWQIGEMKRAENRKVASKAKKSNKKNKDKDDENEEEDNAAEHGAPTTIGLTYREFFRMCSAKFISSTDAQFRTQLVEFKDHHLVIFAPGPDRGEDVLFIPLGREAIESILETMEI